ncbi:MAG: transporter substrate-binding protein [Rhodocyclales bacterium]|nr:transporter substrate-binding protein [Rhodocyclales bacterium]
MRVSIRKLRTYVFACTALAFLLPDIQALAAPQEVVVGIGTQSTTTNTVTGGIVIEKLGLLDKYMPKTGKYANIKFTIDWQNFTSGPPVTNGMIANKLQIGMMGDYPLLVNGATFQAGTETKSRLIAVIAYNLYGAGNGIVVNKDSPYYQLSDLKGKKISVPFGSAAHGMVLKAMEDHGWKEDFWDLSSQTPEVGTTNLQEKKIDAHADFVPFAELLPFRGFARKIYDGVETKLPTFHGIVVRDDFAKQYPEFVVAYLRALMDANDWVRKNPKEAAEKIAEWTHIDKEVVYMFLGPAGIHTLDPTIKAKWIETIKYDTGVLQRMGRVKTFDVDAWADETYIREAFKERGDDYDKQKASFASTEVTGKDPFCKKPIGKSIEAGEIWLKTGELTAYSSAVCTFGAIKALQAQGKQIGVAFLFDQNLNIKLFANHAFFAFSDKDPKNLSIDPFLLKKDAEAYAAKSGGKVLDYEQVLALVK